MADVEMIFPDKVCEGCDACARGVDSGALTLDP
jgi:MinD superfamily P-loop ATPase